MYPGEEPETYAGGRIKKVNLETGTVEVLYTDGNVCVATIVDGGITVLKAGGGAPEFVPLPDIVTTNICFGGEDFVHRLRDALFQRQAN